MGILDYSVWRPPLVFGLIGQTGGGKTRSALELARGMVGPDGRIELIDTEMGRAALQRAHCQPWAHAKLEPPFTPGRYVEAIQEVQAKKPDAIIVDSASHEWAGLGGCLEMVDASPIKNDHAKWAYPSAQHKRFTNHLLASKVPIILCLRAAEKTRQVKNPATGKIEIVNDGLQPIQRPGFVYELTISLLIENGGYPILLKGDDAINHAFPPDQRVGRATGEAMRRWIDSMAGLGDDEFEVFKAQATEKANLGSVALRDWFMGLANADRARIKPITDNLKSIAAEADRITAEADRVAQESAA